MFLAWWVWHPYSKLLSRVGWRAMGYPSQLDLMDPGLLLAVVGTSLPLWVGSISIYYSSRLSWVSKLKKLNMELFRTNLLLITIRELLYLSWN